MYFRCCRAVFSLFLARCPSCVFSFSHTRKRCAVSISIAPRAKGSGAHTHTHTHKGRGRDRPSPTQAHSHPIAPLRMVCTPSRSQHASDRHFIVFCRSQSIIQTKECTHHHCHRHRHCHHRRFPVSPRCVTHGPISGDFLVLHAPFAFFFGDLLLFFFRCLCRCCGAYPRHSLAGLR